MSSIVHPKPGDLLRLSAGMLIEVISVRLLLPAPRIGWSMWAVDAEVVGARRRRWLGKVDTWHLNPGEFSVESRESTGTRTERRF